MIKPIYEQRMDQALNEKGFYETFFQNKSAKAEAYGKSGLKEFFREEHFYKRAVNDPCFKGLYRQDKSDKKIYNEAEEVKKYLDKRRLDNTGLFFERDTTFMDPEFNTLKYKPLGDWRAWFAIQNVPLGASHVNYKQYEKTGDGASVSARGDGTINFKRSNAKEYMNKQHVYNQGYYYTYAEIRAAAFAGAEIDRADQENTINGFEITAHKNMIVGDASLNITGLINAANVPNVSAAASAAGSNAKPWDGADKTTDEILADIIGMPNKIILDNKNAYGKSGFTIGLPISHLNLIFSTRMGTATDTFIGDIALKAKGGDGLPLIKEFVSIPELSGAGTGSSDMAVCFKARDATLIKARINDQLIFHPPSFNQLRIEYGVEQEMSGLTILHPKSMTQLYDI